MRSSSSRTRRPLVSMPAVVGRVGAARHDGRAAGRAGRANGSAGPCGTLAGSRIGERLGHDPTDRPSRLDAVGSGRRADVAVGGDRRPPRRPTSGLRWQSTPHRRSMATSDCRTACSSPLSQAPLELVERRHQALPVERDLGPETGDRRVVGRLDLLGLVVQPLVQPLARPGAGDLDLDVLVGAQAGEPDHLPGEGEDRRRLAHVEQEDLPAVGHRARLQHEAHRLGDGHEVAGHLRAGDRHRPAVEDLAQERRHHAAAAAEHVAEAHGRVGQAVVAADADHHLLGRPLGRTHHRAGMGGLVGGEVHEATGSRSRRRALARRHVLSTLVVAAWVGGRSRMGTCLLAAAWNTTSGRVASKSSASRSTSRMSSRIVSAVGQRARPRRRAAGSRRGRGAAAGPGCSERPGGRSRCRSSRRLR